MEVLKKLIEKLLMPPIKFVSRRIHDDLIQRSVGSCEFKTLRDIASMRSLEDSCDYVLSKGESAVLFHHKPQLQEYVSNLIKGKDGLFLEFGVFRGESINFFSSMHPEIKFHGFDSFEGLPESWGGSEFSKGHFSLKGNLPKVNSNVYLIKGWFDESLPEFLREKKGSIAFLHIDADLYSSTKTVLDLLCDRLMPGSIILFDEYQGYPGWRNSEYRAWQEYCQKNNVSYDYLAFSTMQAVVIIK
jgi:hypothetical protein